MSRIFWEPKVESEEMDDRLSEVFAAQYTRLKNDGGNNIIELDESDVPFLDGIRLTANLLGENTISSDAGRLADALVDNVVKIWIQEY